MSDSVPPAGAIAAGRRIAQRRTGDPLPDDAHETAARNDSDGRSAAAAPAPAPVSAETPKSRLESLAAFAAQLLGQGGQKRGLRGGPETLEHARATYLETEWSGPSDRRIRAGRITKTEI
jgi:hypothetical protein